ncbi:MAG: hypothetical protein BWY55_00787 [archaeon ADurb.Bin336]|nr:MAG: hypothetical protein BWY55_00787 [archaeon ADurb.Bin336]
MVQTMKKRIQDRRAKNILKRGERSLNNSVKVTSNELARQAKIRKEAQKLQEAKRREALRKTLKVQHEARQKAPSTKGRVNMVSGLEVQRAIQRSKLRRQ